jgi:hypothetical protein
MPLRRTSHQQNSVPLKEHLLTIRAADDRRYAEVALEREKALRIKDDADKTALSLAREIQTYKDEKANELREQINSERGIYATKSELQAAMREIVAGVGKKAETSTTFWFSMIAASAAVTGVVVAMLSRFGP